MENQMSQTRSMYSEELRDSVFIFKISNDPRLAEKLKNVEKPEVFTPLKEFCNDQIKVGLFFITKLIFIAQDTLQFKKR